MMNSLEFGGFETAELKRIEGRNIHFVGRHTHKHKHTLTKKPPHTFSWNMNIPIYRKLWAFSFNISEGFHFLPSFFW